jgi:glutamyl-tRNA synthetase
VHGSISFENAHIEDFVILRSDRQPTYHLSVVADDIDMAITHVIRGDDHISNTPKQLLLYRAFATEPPVFAHVPLILGPDRKRLSKRHGATSVMEYHRLGYVPEAMVNFLSLLGWSPGDDRELFTRDELTAAFALEGIGGGNAIFNPDKLDWFNQQHILRLSLEDLATRLRPVLTDAGLWTADLDGIRRDWFLTLIALVRPRVKRMGQFAEEMRPFLVESVEYDPAAVAKHLTRPGIAQAIGSLVQALVSVPVFDQQTLEAVVRETAEAAGLKGAALIHATRVAVTGRAVSPGLFEVMALLGRERTTERLRAAQKFPPA